MNRLNIFGRLNKLSSSSAFSWAAYWAGQGEPIFFGEVSKITDGKLYNQKRGASDYLTVTGAAGSYTFQCPNTAPYIAADTDFIWFKTDASQRTTTEAELIGYDFGRTIIKYDNTSPYALRWIMILSSAFETARENKMRDSFWLSMWWSGVLSLHGDIKQNRGSAKNDWITLLSDLVAYWKLDEASGDASDVNGVYTLTNNNTVSYVAGKIGNGASTETSNTNKSLTKDSTFGMIYTSTRSIAGWVNINTAPAEGTNLALISLLFATTPGSYTVMFYRRGGGDYYLHCNTGAEYKKTLTPGTWYHLCVTWDQVDNKVNLYIDGVNRIIDDPGLSGSYAALTSRFSIGNFNNGAFSSLIADEVGLWSKILSPTEILDLYNSGNGKSHPFKL